MNQNLSVVKKVILLKIGYYVVLTMHRVVTLVTEKLHGETVVMLLWY